MDDLTNCDHGMYDYFDALELDPSAERPHTWDVYDARGIYLCKVCEKCERAKLATYRPEVLSDPSYYADEPIEPSV